MRILILASLLLASPALAQEPITSSGSTFQLYDSGHTMSPNNWTINGSSIGVSQPEQQNLSIGGLVTIHPDGTIEYGPGYTPDAAAKVFWQAIGEQRAKCD